MLRSRAFWIPLIGLVPIAVMYNGVQFHLGTLVLDYVHDAALAAQLIAVSAASVISGMLLFGTLADKMDHRKI